MNYNTNLGALPRRAFLAGCAIAVSLPFAAAAETGSLPPLETVEGLAFDGPSALLAADGLWRSEDGGLIWSSVSKLPESETTALATHPDRPGTLYAAQAGGGVLRSEDGGKTWGEAGDGLPGQRVEAIAIAADKPDTLFASVRGDGIWRSENGGDSWELEMDRPYVDGAERDALTLASVANPTGMGGIWIYAGTDQGLTRVPDCFCRWQDVQPDGAMDALVEGTAPAAQAPLPAGEAVFEIALSHADPDVLYAGLPSGIWKSADAGVVWTKLVSGRTTHLAVHPEDSDRVIAAGDGENRISSDGGATWAAIAAE